LLWATINKASRGGRQQEIAAQWADPVGSAIKWASNAAGCIIITACTARDSEEVNVTREYREKFLTPVDLRGYYLLAERVVPIIERFKSVKWITKKVLVDSLISYGRHKLYGEKKPGIIRTMITKGFLALCRGLGSRRESFVRANGEIY
jgi:hypothetical protein